MKFRPCIDLHQGKVKQIVGSTLSDEKNSAPETNFTSDKPPAWYANLYRKDKLSGGHVIKLGPGNELAAKEALSAWKGGLQIGGGITSDNAVSWLEAGASDVIVTSYVFNRGQVHEERLKKLAGSVGTENLVLDLSCRKKDGVYHIVTDRWQNFTDVEVNKASLDYFAEFCHEFLIHAVDVEGKAGGIEVDLVDILGNWGKKPVTYAGGIHSLADIELIKTRGKGKLDFTVGSALDIFGGDKLTYSELVKLN